MTIIRKVTDVAGRYREILLFVGLSLLTFAITYFAVGDRFWTGLNLPERVSNDGTRQIEPEVPKEHGKKINVLMQVKYTGCSHVLDFARELVDVGDVNIPDDFRILYPDFEVYSVSDTEAVLIKYEDGLCPDRGRHVHIGIHAGKVAFYQGPPEAGILIDETDIPVKNLPRTEIEALTRGIETGSKEELLEILEGLSSLTPF